MSDSHDKGQASPPAWWPKDGFGKVAEIDPVSVDGSVAITTPVAAAVFNAHQLAGVERMLRAAGLERQAAAVRVLRADLILVARDGGHELDPLETA